MKYYKVYEIIEDNKKLDLQCKVCVGIFKNEAKAKYIAYVIDVQDCNKTEIIYDDITKQDLLDLQKYYKGSDCEKEIIEISKKFFKNERELIK